MIQKPVAAERLLAAVTPPTIVVAEANSSNRSKIIGGFSNASATADLRPKPRTHIAFLKVHKAASSTVQNILYRFGSERDLSFVLPYNGHYVSKDADTYGEVLPSMDKSGKYDIICNHVVFNYWKFKSLMYDDAFYLAIVRNPLKRFVSAAYYYRYMYMYINPYLGEVNRSTFLHDLITNPLKYEPNFKDSKTFNHLAFDFGLAVPSIEEVMSLDEETKNMFVSHIMEKFHFVMLVEKFDESLVILKRHLNWTIKDILYIKQNQFQNVTDNADIIIQNVTAEDEARFKLTNHLDYLIYNKFVERFNDLASKENDLDAEVKEFKRKLELVEAFCIIDTTRREAIFWETEFDVAFRVNRYDCELMMKDELTFNEELRKKQLSFLENTNSDKPRS